MQGRVRLWEPLKPVKQSHVLLSYRCGFQLIRSISQRCYIGYSSCDVLLATSLLWFPYDVLVQGLKHPLLTAGTSSLRADRRRVRRARMIISGRRVWWSWLSATTVTAFIAETTSRLQTVKVFRWSGPEQWNCILYRKTAANRGIAYIKVGIAYNIMVSVTFR